MPSPAWRRAGFLAVTAVVLFHFYFVFTSTLNIPFSDDYATLDFLLQWRDASFFGKIRALFEPNNEHFVLPVRLAALGEVAFTGTVNFTVLTLLGNMNLVFLFLLLVRILPPERRLVAVPCSFLLFQTQYWDNTLMAVCAMEGLGVVFYALAAFVLLDRPGHRCFAGAIAMALAAFSSFGSGLFVFPVGLAALLIRRQHRRAVIWTSVFVLLIPLITLLGRIAGESGPGQVLARPLDALQWFLAFLGSSLGYVAMPPCWSTPATLCLAMATGAIILIAFALLTSRRSWNVCMPTYALFLFLLLAAVTATVFRFDREPAGAPRYQFISILLVILCVMELFRRISARLFPAALGVLLMVSVAFHATAYAVQREFVTLHKNRLVFDLVGWAHQGTRLSFFGDAAAANDIMLGTLQCGYYRIPSTEELLPLVRLENAGHEEHVKRGRMYMFTKQYDRAIADFDTALRIQPGYEYARRGRLIAHALAGHREKAVEDARYLELHGTPAPPDVLQLIPGP